jgi:hypothetical protein
MKKIFFFAVVIMIIITLPTFANKQTGWPFVHWGEGNYPNLTLEQSVAVLKAAMQGQQVPGAKRVYGNRTAYEQVWGTALYNYVLSADPSEFYFSTAQGDEPNYSVLNGRAQEEGFIARGTKVLALHGQILCKIGKNWCFNPTPFVLDQKPPVDPDVVPKPYKREATSNSTGDAKAEAVARVEITDLRTGKGQQQGTSLDEAIGNYKTLNGLVREGVANAMSDANGLLTLSRMSSCCNGQPQGGGSGGAGGITYLVTSNTAPQGQQDAQQRYPTFMGAVARQALGTAIGVGTVWGVSQLIGSRGRAQQPYYPQPGWSNQWPGNSPGFSGPSGPTGNSWSGFNAGSAPSGATGGYINTNTTGQWTNTW